MASAPLGTQPWYWLLWVMPLAARLAALSGSAAKCTSSATPRQSVVHAPKQSRAPEVLAQVLKEADTVAKMTRVQTLLIEYLSARLHQPIAGLTRNALAALLTAHQVDAALIDRTLECLDSVETLRFSPAMAEPACRRGAAGHNGNADCHPG